MKGRLFWRSLFIQAAWNPRDLQGAGLEWAIAAVSERPGGPDDPSETDAEAAENVYNGHPYLSGIAIGALVTERERGTGSAELGRLRRALRGPLGALGDALVWTGWVPAALLLAAAAGLAGVSPLIAVLVFLALHNAAHCTLRWWGVGAGLAQGRSVGLALQRANLARVAARVRSLALFAAGLFAGLAAMHGWATLESPVPWLVVGGGALLAGAWRGMRLPGWTPAALALGLVGLARIWGL